MSVAMQNLDTWAGFDRDDARFRRILGWVALPFLVLGILIPLWELAGLQEGGGEPVSERFAALLLEQAAQQAEEPEPQAVELPEPDPEPEVEQSTDPEPEPEPQEATTPDPQPEPEPQPTQRPQPTQAPTPPPVDRSVQARQKVQQQLSGALQALQSLQSEPVVSANQNRPLRQAQRPASSEPTDSSNVVAGAFSGNSGARVGDIERQRNSSTALGERRRAEGGQRQISASGGGIGAARDRAGYGGDQRNMGRSLEEIQLVMDRNKGGLYAIYNRALRRNPALAGKLVLKMTIAPNGAITAVSIVSSELADDDLERKVLARVRLINFGAKDVETITINYPIYFAPS